MPGESGKEPAATSTTLLKNGRRRIGSLLCKSWPSKTSQKGTAVIQFPVADRAARRCTAVAAGVVLTAMLLVSGCGGSDIYPVEGVIVDGDGQPIKELAGGSVEFESVEAKMG